MIDPERQEAMYRAQLKRIIRAAAGRVDNEAPTLHLEHQIGHISACAPMVIARALDRLFVDAARHWERGNNSGSNEVMDREYAECDLRRRVAERILDAWNVTVDYPGLYPAFSWNGGDYYEVGSLLQAIIYPRKPRTAVTNPGENP